MHKKALIIFSGFNQRAVIALLRTLSKHNILFGIIAVSEDDNIFLTDYKKHIVYTRKSVPLVFDDLLLSLQTAKKELCAEEVVIIPSTEALVRFVLENRMEFEKINATIPLVDKAVYNQISDKFSFSRVCKENGIKLPIEYSSLKETKFPFVAKPKTYYSGTSKKTLAPIIIYNQEQKASFIKCHHDNDFYYQAFVEGKSRYLLYYFHSDGSTYKFSQENLVQQPGGKSIVAAVSSDFHFSEESMKYEKLFSKINFSGFAMIEVIGDNYMIESNPRLWGPSQLFVDAKANLFEAFLHDIGLISEKPSHNIDTNNEVLYFWHGGIIKTAVNNQKLDFHNYNSIKLAENYHDFIASDIFRRADTYKMFTEEVNL